MNRRYALCLGLLAASCSAAAFVACGNDSGGGGGGGGTDAGADHAVTPDATTPDSGGGGNDGSTKDSTTTDTGSGEGSTGEGGGGDATGGGDASDGGGGGCQLFDASGLDDASVAAGFAQVWQVYKCYKCHQNPTDLVDDAGNGILLNGNDAGLGDSGKIFPPNLTNSEEGLGCWTNDQIATAILQGKDQEGGALCPPMPVFGQEGGAGRPMDAGTAQEIIDYIRSLQISHKTTPDTTCSSAPSDGGGSDAAGDAPTDAGGQ